MAQDSETFSLPPEETSLPSNDPAQVLLLPSHVKSAATYLS